MKNLNNSIYEVSGNELRKKGHFFNIVRASSSKEAKKMITSQLIGPRRFISNFSARKVKASKYPRLPAKKGIY